MLESWGVVLKLFLFWFSFFLIGLMNTSGGTKNRAIKVKLLEWLIQSLWVRHRLTVVTGLLCVTVLEKSLSGTTWEENPVNLVSLLCVKLLGAAFSSWSQWTKVRKFSCWCHLKKQSLIMLFEDISVAGLCSDPTAFGTFKVIIKPLKMVHCLLVTYFALHFLHNQPKFDY